MGGFLRLLHGKDKSEASRDPCHCQLSHPSTMLFHISCHFFVFAWSHSMHWLLHKHYYYCCSVLFCFIFLVSLKNTTLFPQLWPCCVFKFKHFIYTENAMKLTYFLQSKFKLTEYKSM